MNEQRIEELKNALREVMQLVTSRNQPLTNELRQMLFQVFEHVGNRIQQLRQEDQNPVEGLPPTNPQEPQLNAGMPSSNIHSFGYDDKSGRLLVKFQGEYPRENGPVYAYGGVPKVIYDLFRKGAVPARTDGQNKWGRWWKGKVPSLGASLFTLIKNGGYPYQRLT
jgi:KTSC domain